MFAAGSTLFMLLGHLLAHDLVAGTTLTSDYWNADRANACQIREGHRSLVGGRTAAELGKHVFG